MSGELTGLIRAKGLEAVVALAGPSDNAPDELAAADVVVIPSVWESGPLVLAEALTLMRPVVATPVGLVPECIREGESGRIVPIGDARALADAVAALLADPAAAARHGRGRPRRGPTGPGRRRPGRRHGGAVPGPPPPGMTRALPVIRAGRCLAALGLAVTVTVGRPPAAARRRRRADQPPGQVLIVSMPRLVWQDVADQQPPNLMRLLERSAVASLSVRAIGPRTDLGEGYVTLGAGNRARVDRYRAGDAVDADEQIGPTTGAGLYQAVTGHDPEGAAVLSLAVEEARADADHLLYGSVPGSARTDAARRWAVRRGHRQRRRGTARRFGRTPS